MNVREDIYDRSFSRILETKISKLASKLACSKSKTLTSVIFGLPHGLDKDLYDILESENGSLPCGFRLIDGICQIIILVDPIYPENLIKLKPEYQSCLSILLKFQNNFDSFYIKVLENKKKIEVSKTIIDLMDSIKNLINRQIREIEFFIERIEVAIKQGEVFTNLISKRNKADYSLYLEKQKEYEKRLLEDFAFYKAL